MLHVQTTLTPSSTFSGSTPGYLHYMYMYLQWTTIGPDGLYSSLIRRWKARMGVAYSGTPWSGHEVKWYWARGNASSEIPGNWNIQQEWDTSEMKYTVMIISSTYMYMWSFLPDTVCRFEISCTAQIYMFDQTVGYQSHTHLTNHLYMHTQFPNTTHTQYL